jgi:4-amino-4-deoxy-L-arabinose transferase-like glycosyltransferase
VWSPARVAAAILTFGVVLAPNLIWNASHHFATLEHTAANADLGGRLFNPGEMLTFVGEQFGVFGPVAFLTLIVGAVMAIRRRHIGEAELLLACWTLPALVVVTGQAFLSRANANWAASAYVAGSVLVAGILIQGLHGRHRKAALAGLGGILLIQGALAGFLLTAAAQPTVMDTLGRSNDIKRVRGWEQMTEAVIRRAEVEAVNGGISAIAVDDRFMFNAMAYYGRDYFARPGAAPLTIWVKGKPGNQAEVEAPLTPAVGERVLVAALEDREGRKAQRIGADFRTSQSVEIVSVLLSPRCKVKDGEADAKFDHRCRRRATLILGERFAPVKRPD